MCGLRRQLSAESEPVLLTETEFHWPHFAANLEHISILTSKIFSLAFIPEFKFTHLPCSLSISSESCVTRAYHTDPKNSNSQSLTPSQCQKSQSTPTKPQGPVQSTTKPSLQTVSYSVLGSSLKISRGR